MGFFKKLGRVAAGIGSVGLSELGRKDSFGISGAQQYIPMVAGAGLGAMFGNPMMGAQIGTSIYSGMQQARMAQDANAQNLAMAREQMAFSADQAQAQMAFQERMSSTSVQRMKEDMIKAGINPMLAAGAGESTPSGSSGSPAGYAANVVPGWASGAIFSAKDLIGTLQNVQESNSRIDLNRKNADLSVTTKDKMSADAFIAKMKMKMLKSLYNSGQSFWNSGKLKMLRSGVSETPVDRLIDDFFN